MLLHTTHWFWRPRLGSWWNRILIKPHGMRETQLLRAERQATRAVLTALVLCYTQNVSKKQKHLRVETS